MPTIQLGSARFVYPDAEAYSLTLGIDVCTKFADGTYHPDFRATPLFAASVRFFRQHNILPVEHVLGQWGPASDNWQQYEASLALFGAGVVTHEQELAAANSTWSGRSANALGFFAASVKHFSGAHSAIFTLGAPNYRTPQSAA